MRTKGYFRKCFAVVLAVSLSAVAWTECAVAGTFLGDWFVIGTDAGPPTYHQLFPSIAFNSDRGEYLVVWHNERPVYPDIQAQRVGIDGRLVGGPFYVAGGPYVQRRFPDVAYNPAQKEYLVVWEALPDGSPSNIHAQRIGAAGGLIGNAFAVGGGPPQTSRSKPAIAYASTSDLYMVVWERLLHGASSHDIEAKVLSGTGSAVGTSFLVATGSATLNHFDPDIAYNRSRNEHLIVWTREDLNVSIMDVWGQIITRDGYLLGSDFFIGYHTSNDFDPSVVGTPVAPGFGGYYVVWTMQYSAEDFDIYGKEVGWDGLTGGYDQISTGFSSDFHPAVTYDETENLFFVAWSRLINQSLGTTDVIGFPYRLGSFPGVIESCVGGSSFAVLPAVAPGTGGDFLVTWSDAPGTPNRDIWGRIWSLWTIFSDGFEYGSCVRWSQEVPGAK